MKLEIVPTLLFYIFKNIRFPFISPTKTKYLATNKKEIL